MSEKFKKRNKTHSSKNDTKADLMKAGPSGSKDLVEFEPKDDNDCDTEAITKEEEWITKKKTELTTTRQIETRVKRQVVLEDGKVVEDSGPIVSTNTTEDTDKQETETTEKRDGGIPESDIGNVSTGLALQPGDHDDGNQVAEVTDGGGLCIKKMVPRPADGLVRESNDKRVLTHEEVKDYLETEDIKHLGDFSDESYVKAVNSGAGNLEELLLSPESQQQLVPLGPRVVANTTKSFKTIDAEDEQHRCLAQADGTLVTEKKKTTEHEIIVDKELPEREDNSTGSREKITTAEAKQHFFKQRDEQNVDLIVDGKVVNTEMRYAAETMQMEKDGSLERPGDWDSLSDRMRKMRKAPQKSVLQQQKEATLLADRKDALTKRPLDFDREEETRKGETMKWLESHFGSESTASNDSRDDDAEVEPTKKTYFNVTIKSNQAGTATNGSKAPTAYDKKIIKEQESYAGGSRSRYYQGITNWADRREVPPNHFSSKAFRDDLHETVERNRLRKNAALGSREKLHDGRYLKDPSESYVSREDIMHHKRQSLSSQFLARTRNSRENLLDYEPAQTLREGVRNVSGSRTDLRYGMGSQDESSRVYSRTSNADRPDMGSASKHADINYDAKAKSYDRELNNIGHESMRTPLKLTARSSSPDAVHNSSTLGRPTVPQRRRAIEKKLRQQSSISPPLKVPFRHQGGLAEPPPDYSPPPRSRSSSPQADCGAGERAKSAASNSQVITTNTLMRKQNQRTRFAPTTAAQTYYPPQHQMRLTMATATQTTPSTISTSTAASQKSNRVGQAIGNSIRKLVNKIRSASAERKLRKKSKSREQSPATHAAGKEKILQASTTYQQYNVIDGHIGGQAASNESEEAESIHHNSLIVNKQFKAPAMVERGSPQVFKGANSADPFSNHKDMDPVICPRQRYYLGEDPYSSTLYGKENMYDPETIAKRNRNLMTELEAEYSHGGTRETNTNKREDINTQARRNVSSNTLGRYQKNGQVLAEAASSPAREYRSVQTLPRKLNDHPRHSQQRYNKDVQRFVTPGHTTIGPPDRSQYPVPLQNAGPAKPARTYAKSLNRSKSFNVYGLNGSNDPSPIYIEKLTKNNYSNNLHSSQAYKSNPHLYSSTKDNTMLQSGLKSPSIVNLISRSQKDLSKIDAIDADHETYARHAQFESKLPQRDDKRHIFLKGLHQQAPDLYRSIHGDEDCASKTLQYHVKRKPSIDSRSPIEINKDTASLTRRRSPSNDDYVISPYSSNASSAYIKKTHIFKDELKSRGPTIIEVRGIDRRK